MGVLSEQSAADRTLAERRRRACLVTRSSGAVGDGVRLLPQCRLGSASWSVGQHWQQQFKLPLVMLLLAACCRLTLVCISQTFLTRT
jgi:hypothetical protein